MIFRTCLCLPGMRWESSMKTIFITSFHPHISRNILATDVLPLLIQQGDIRVVLLVPLYKVDYFREQFECSCVVIEGIKPYQSSKKFIGIFFKRLGVFLFNTKTASIKREYEYYWNGNLLRYAAAVCFGFAGRSRFVRQIVRALDSRLCPHGFFREVIERYHPDVVCSTDPQNENDVSLLHDARQRGIPVIAMLRSWDNVTQRILRVLPDQLLVGSHTLAQSVIDLYGYPAQNLSVVGTPHYDHYLKGADRTRTQFFTDLGLDFNKKLILYAPVGDMLIRTNDIDQYVMEILGTIDANILVRFPPDENVRLVNFVKPKNMVFDRPGQHFKSSEFADREIRPQDDQRLINSLYYSDLVITGPTSICLDAAFFDKPVITVELYPTPRRNIYEGVWSYQCDHIQRLFKTNGVRHVTTKEDFLKAIHTYLTSPQEDQEGRARIRECWFSLSDGKAGERIARELISFLNRAVLS